MRNEIGHRFEEYCANLLNWTQPAITYSTEISYSVSKNEFRSPDIMLGTNDARWALIECKAARMSFPARFSDASESERGYKEIAKAVFQIWRFVAHCRLNIANNRIATGCVGVVLTLDSWMMLGSAGPADNVFELAREMFATKVPKGIPDDQIPITFCQVPEWEMLLTSSNAAGVRRLLKLSGSEEYRGWFISSIPKLRNQRKKYRLPFRDFNDVIPWWGLRHLRDQPYPKRNEE